MSLSPPPTQPPLEKKKKTKKKRGKPKYSILVLLPALIQFCKALPQKRWHQFLFWEWKLRVLLAMVTSVLAAMGIPFSYSLSVFNKTLFEWWIASLSKGKGNIGICCDFFGLGLGPRQSFAFVSRGTFLAVDAEATSLLESLETSLAGVRTARKHLRLEIGKFSAIDEVSNDQRC